MKLLDLILGRPLANDESAEQKLGVAAGIPTFGLDALGSAAYGPEAALTMLLPLGAAGVQYIVPISGAVIVLLAIVCASYLQTIPAYPQGGGSYSVASHNLGPSWGLLAATALMIDYVLTVAVGVSTGVGAMVSAVPGWQPHTMGLCLGILLVITLVNLRGTRDSGVIFAIPTYLFIGCMVGTLGLGLYHISGSSGRLVPLVAPPLLAGVGMPVTTWLMLKSFASGCTAMTGVEAVSNGVKAFREPRTRTARRTLLVIVGLLVFMLAAIGVLCRAYGVGATPPGRAGYESVLSQLTGAIAGKGVFYRTTTGAVLLALSFQANTAFADFPRLCRVLSQDGYLPSSFAGRGRRLVHTGGILALAAISGLLLIVFGGVTDRMIPFFAVGAFLAFTLSQAGMVMHWKRTDERGARAKSILNATGAIATAGTLVIVVISKFAEGAWFVLLLIPAIFATLRTIHQHYRRVDRELAYCSPLSLDSICSPVVVVLLEEWSRVSHRALRFGLSISNSVVAIHVKTEGATNDLEAKWGEWVAQPAKEHRIPAPELVVLTSPYRQVIDPVVEYVLQLERKHPDRQIAVIVPNLVERHWYHRFLHNQRGVILTAILLLNGNKRISIVNVPWDLKS